MNKVATKKKDNAGSAFAGLDDVLAGGFDMSLASDEADVMLNLDDIEIVEQVRDKENFEDDENTLADLGRNLRKRQLQSILVRPIEGGPKPYRLVIGERRYRAARLEGLTQLRSRIVAMTDEEADDAQFAENIHRKNLTMIEEAKRVQRDLDTLGSVDAVLEKHNKSRAWLSKILALLNLPEQAKRLVSEKVTADLEVINTVKTIEKANPEAAKKLVDDLKATRGKADARKQATAVKDEVKPSPKKAAKKEAAKKDADAKDAGKSGGTVATPKDRKDEEPGPVSSKPGSGNWIRDLNNVGAASAANNTDDLDEDLEEDEQSDSAPLPALAPAEALHNTYTLIFENGAVPKTVLDTMKEADREACEGWLKSFYDAGTKANELGRAVIQGFRNGQFAADGAGAFALAAFLHGADSDAKFNMLNVLGCVKK